MATQTATLLVSLSLRDHAVDADSVVFGSGGLYNTETSTVIAAEGTALTRTSLGVYSYSFEYDDAQETFSWNNYTFSIKRFYGRINYVSTGTGALTVLDETLSYSYINLAEADAYLYREKLDLAPWETASQHERETALRAATSAIERLPFRGAKASTSQTYQFPRGDDDDIPEDIRRACAELAFAFLDGVDPEFEYDNLIVTSKKLGPVSTTSTPNVSREHIVAGIVSATAWRLLRPYVRSFGSMRVERA
jgi:hypothetical protein